MRRVLLVALTLAAVLALAPAAAQACVRVGVYQDNPTTNYAKLSDKVGKGVGMISAYVTAGRPLNPSLVRFANRRRVGLMVTWQPDKGSDGANQPKHRLKRTIRGSYDRSLRALARRMDGVRGRKILRPMPEPNTPWYAWSGLVNRNTTKDYVLAWRHVHKVVRKASRRKVKLLWTPYARSVPDSGPNAIRAYFPGKKYIDYVGAVAYNFGNRGKLTWTEPAALFARAYQTIQALANKPFWIAETGSTTSGGDQAAWVRSLIALDSTLPRLAGVFWFDAKARTGDFRITKSKTRRAFKSLLKRRCR